MLHLIYKKLKKNKVLLLSTSFLSLPTLLISCIHPYQELQKHISKSLVPDKGDYNPKTADPEKGSPILEENSEIISNSVLGFNGQNKNPKVAKNRFDVAKNYTEEIPEASFVSGKAGTGKYGLLPYWYFLQSIPKYLENKGFGARRYNKEEYLKRLDYFYKKIREYFNRNLVDYQSRDNPGEAEVWKQGLRNQFEKSREAQKSKLNFSSQEDLTDKDKVVEPTQIKTRTYLPIIKPELDRYNSQIPNDESIKYAIVFDFLLANERIWPSSVDKTAFANTRYLDKARLFRDDYYIEKGYKPSDPEKLWYELGWFMLRVQRIISSANAARNILETIHEIEKGLFELTDQNKDIDYQLVSELDIVGNFRDALEKFLTPGNHLNLRKDLVFNIDISNNQDDQSLISDFIDYYNQKIAPIIWRINLKRKAEDKILTLTKLLKNRNDNNYFNTYLAPLLPEIKDLRDEEDVKSDQTLSEETKEKAIEGAKKAGIKEWGIWLRNYQDKYGIKFKEEPGIDSDGFDHESSSSVVRPDRVQSISSNNAQQTTQQKTEEIQETQEPVEAQS
ncbi:hypothetical protein [Mesomycoplasma ovipneumoniae]|uniref:Lipoprotein n=1 Tax=Mesomycoplasma ovipneumoniae 14811 TaxID=1188239 RepID=A0A014L647_9BACT|nr:hypothetical protein [Mesomycoplasma ovipneumoniae]EXU60944.1 Hypothetical protein, predicted lipoprotein [Mesomycoplasma ovipneumoniae 14811]